ncbi:MAG: hypothetical protein AAFO07_12485 [Bacteroidota bacterium]
MKNAAFPIFLLCCLFSLSVKSQSVLNTSVDLDYRSARIELILQDIENNYKIPFSYSSYYIPVDKTATITVASTPLYEALDILFDKTAVKYEEMSGKVLLSIDQEEKKRLEELAYYEKLRQQQERLIAIKKAEKARLATKPIYRKYKSNPLNSISINPTVDLTQYVLPPIEEDTIETIDVAPPMTQEMRDYQISLFTGVSTSGPGARYYTNEMSLNLLWGNNGGLDGVEVGGLFNVIQKNVIGIQAAGFGNFVKGDLNGVQASLGINTVNGNADGVQVAGLLNSVGKTFKGVQASGLINTAKGTRNTIQVALFLNNTKGDARSQVSGVFNFAKNDVSSNQIAGLLNVAKKVDGFQIGLINVADSVGTASIGLLSFIKNGHNRVEFSVNDIFYGNFQLRLGVKQFYNILLLSGRLNNEVDPNAPQTEELLLSWGLGYGLGSAVTLGTRTDLNFEVMATHINEKQFWTNKMNLWTQFRTTFDIRIGKKTSLFLGPSLNALFSKRTDNEGSVVGSSLVGNTFLNELSSNGKVNTQMWIGFSGGIRF